MGRSDWKNEKDLPEKGEGLALNTEGLSQNRECPVQKHDRSDLEKERLVDTSQPSYIRFSPEVKKCNVFCSVHGLK